MFHSIMNVDHRAVTESMTVSPVQIAGTSITLVTDSSNHIFEILFVASLKL